MNKYHILDLAMNLNRIGNWITEDYTSKKSRIIIVLEQTDELISHIEINNLSKMSKLTFEKFLQEYPQLKNTIKNNTVKDVITAERMMTWGNILTHKASLILLD